MTSQLTAPCETELQFAGAEQWSLVMKQKTSLKDLTQLFVMITAALNAAIVLIDLLGKVFNYAGRFPELCVLVPER